MNVEVWCNVMLLALFFSFVHSCHVPGSLRRLNHVNISNWFPLLNLIYSQRRIEKKRSRWDCKFRYFFFLHSTCVLCSICTIHLSVFPTQTSYLFFNKHFSMWGSVHTSSRQYLRRNVAVAAGLCGCWQANTCNCQIRARVVPLINQGLHYSGCH